MTGRHPLLLIIDDHPGMAAVVERGVEGTGFRTVSHTSAAAALALLATARADAALVNQQMPDRGGLEVLCAIRDVQPECGVIITTAHAASDSAIDAVKLGALDYLPKPLDFARLRHLLATIVDDAERRAALLSVEHATAHRLGLGGMIGRSAVMQQLFGLLRRVAPHAKAALIAGEHGVGKAGVARAIHQLGPRSARRCASVNCSAAVPILVESELFGHVRGAFEDAIDDAGGIFEAANEGTVFLDEVGELPGVAQAKLLRVLETGEVQRVGAEESKTVDVRIVAATSRNLRSEVAAGRFRADLYDRRHADRAWTDAHRGRRGRGNGWGPSPPWRHRARPHRPCARGRPLEQGGGGAAAGHQPAHPLSAARAARADRLSRKRNGGPPPLRPEAGARPFQLHLVFREVRIVGDRGADLRIRRRFYRRFLVTAARGEPCTTTKSAGLWCGCG
ncbi:MAG: sigma 54-interacting transcriptional regulator [Vicinamibacterales bacterium]